MRKKRQKFALFAVFCAVILITNACIEPADILHFFEDEEVAEIIEKTRVTLIDLSGDNLVVGNQIISELNPNKYYMMLINDENGDPVGNNSGYHYIKSDGSFSENLIDIEKASSKYILGLYNNYEYTVWAASPMTGQMIVYNVPNLPLPLQGGSTVSVSNGVITVNYDSYHINFSSFINSLASGSSYELLKIKPAGSSIVTLTADNTIKLEGQNTTTEYLFAVTNSYGTVSLRILTVVIKPYTGSGFPMSVSFTLTIEDIGGTLVITQNAPITVTQTEFKSTGLIITVDTSGISFDTGSLKLWYNNEVIDDYTDDELNISSTTITDPEFTAPGIKEFTIEFTVDSILYSKTFKVEVTL
ncbi:MAG: hypothetical protein FWC22_02265 [Treponema sp.]|nr:hypothetical protein [Treponema sp.]